MIGERLALPYRVAGEELQVTAAIGVSVYPEDGQEAADLLQRADESMYRAKAVERERASDRLRARRCPSVGVVMASPDAMLPFMRRYRCF